MHNPLPPTHTLSLSHSPSKSCRMKSGVSCRMPLSTYCRNKLHTQSLPDWKPLSSWLQHNQTWHSHQRLGTTSLLVTTQSNMTQPPEAMNHLPLGYNTIKHDTATRGYEPPPSWLWHKHDTATRGYEPPPSWLRHKHDTATRGYEPPPSWLRHKHDTTTRGYEPPPSWLLHNQTWHSHQRIWTTSLLVTTQSNMTQPPGAMNHFPLGYYTIKHDTATRGYEPLPSWLQHNQTWHSHQRLWTTSLLVTTQSNVTQPPEAMNHLPLGYNTIKHDTATRGYEPPPTWLQHNKSEMVVTTQYVWNSGYHTINLKQWLQHNKSETVATTQ